MKPVAWKQLAVLLGLALLLRLAAGLYWQSRLPGAFGMPDSESYWALGQAMAQGEPYQFGPEQLRVFRTPGYPLLLAPIFWIAEGQPAVFLARAEAAALGTLAVLGVWWWAGRLFDAQTALIAAAMATFYPGLIGLGALILSEAPFCALLPVQMVLWTAAWRAHLWRWAGVLAVSGGLTAGAATLIRPSWLLFTPFAVLVGVMFPGRDVSAGPTQPPLQRSAGPKGRSRGKHLYLGAAMIAGLVAIMLPWWMRNAAVTGRFVPTTLQVGASLYDGLNPHATGASNMEFVAGFVAEGHAAAGEPTELPEVRLDRRMRTEALRWAAANPGRAAELATIKFCRMWNVWPNEPMFSSWTIRLAVLATYVPVLLLGLIGAARTLRRGWPYWLCWLPAVYFTALHMVFVSSLRYREPAMLGLIVLAAGAITAWRKK